MPASVSPMSDNELARLRLKFQVPMNVARIMETKQYIDDYTEWALRDEFAAMAPERALIALALCAEALAARAGNAEGGQALSLEAGRIIAEHGRHWLAQQKTGGEEMGPHVAEDLESLGDHLLAIWEHLDPHGTDWFMAGLLGTEAHVQYEMVLEFGNRAGKRERERDPEPAMVIAFPGAKTRR